jgi:hypothetical protein
MKRGQRGQIAVKNWPFGGKRSRMPISFSWFGLRASFDGDVLQITLEKLYILVLDTNPNIL